GRIKIDIADHRNASVGPVPELLRIERSPVVIPGIFVLIAAGGVDQDHAMVERILESAIPVRPFFVHWEWIGPPPFPVRFSQKNLFSGTRQIEDLAIDHPSGRRSAHSPDIDRQRGYISGGDTQTVLPGYLDMADFQGYLLLVDFHKMRNGGDTWRRGVKLKNVAFTIRAN